MPSESIDPSATKYCSKVWEMMSDTPAAVCFAGTVMVYVGSRMEATGKQPPTESFSFVSSFVITPAPSYSEPVAAIVITSNTGSFFPIRSR